MAYVRGVAEVREALLAPVPVKCIGFLGEICDEDVEQSIMIDIAKIHAHRSLFATVSTQCRARKQAYILERSIVIVVVEVIRTGVVRHIQVGPAIVVVVAPNALHAKVVLRIVNAGCFRNVLEGAIAAIAEQEVRLAWKAPRSTLHHDPTEPAKLIIAAEFRQLVDVNEHVSRDKQIYLPIALE